MKQISDKAYKRFKAMCQAAGIEPLDGEVADKWTPPEQDYFFTDDEGDFISFRFGSA